MNIRRPLLREHKVDILENVKQAEQYIQSGKLSEEDLKRRNAIVKLLEEWELLEIVDKQKIKDQMPISGLKIIKYNERDNWDLIPKFNPGSLRKFFNS